MMDRVLEPELHRQLSIMFILSEVWQISNLQGTEWLLYVSPWKVDESSETSNIKIICKVAGYSLVSYTPSLQDYGSAIIYNIGQSGWSTIWYSNSTHYFLALKEAKAISVPLAKYSEEGLATTQLDYGSVPDEDIITQSSTG